MFAPGHGFQPNDNYSTHTRGEFYSGVARKRHERVTSTRRELRTVPSYRSVRHGLLALTSFMHSAYVALCIKLVSVLVASMLQQQEGTQLSTLQTADR